MSYILDALRKADAERGRGRLPGLHSQGGTPVYVDRRLLHGANPWLWIVAGLIALLVLLVGAWLAGRTSGPAALPTPVAASPATASPTGSPTASPTASPRLDALTARASDAAARYGDPARVTLPALPSAATPPPPAAPAATPAAPGSTLATPPAPARSGTAAAPAAPPIPIAPAAPATPATPALAAAPAAPATPPASAAFPTPDNRIHALDDLPAEVRRELPSLSFGGLIQLDDPPRRSLIINGAVYLEGDSVQPGLVLDQIRPNAAVLRYRGHRFQMPI